MRLGVSTLPTRTPARPLLNDRELLERCLQHDREAWDTFVRRFGGLVNSVVRSSLTRHAVRDEGAAAEDLFGCVFLALYDKDYRRLRRWDGRCSLATWIRLVSGTVVVDELRRRRPELGVDDLDAESLAARVPLFCVEHQPAVELLERADRIRAVRAGLQQLGDDDRALLERLFRDDVAPGRLARELGVQAGAVYTRKNRALARLRAVLGEDFGHDL